MTAQQDDRPGRPITDLQYWDSVHAELDSEPPSRSHPLRVWIETYAAGLEGKVFEVGCYPGGFLSVFGEMGFELNGIDFGPRVAEVPVSLAGQGYRVGRIEQGDFLGDNGEGFDGGPFDVVCSFGFIEHFEDWEHVLRLHARLVGDTGTLMITCPNFAGAVQGTLHRWLDRENYLRHNVDAMRPGRWADILRPLGFEVVFSGWMGRFAFWTEDAPSSTVVRAGRATVPVVSPIFKAMGPGRASLAPMCGLVAHRRE
jgi:SAM-dependent methyltransferase